jgi:hypothetical protein
MKEVKLIISDEVYDACPCPEGMKIGHFEKRSPEKDELYLTELNVWTRWPIGATGNFSYNMPIFTPDPEAHQKSFDAWKEGAKVGDMVKVMRVPTEKEIELTQCCDNSQEKARMVGRTYEITRLYDEYISVDRWHFTHNCLEKVTLPQFKKGDAGVRVTLDGETYTLFLLSGRVCNWDNGDMTWDKYGKAFPNEDCTQAEAEEFLGMTFDGETMKKPEPEFVDVEVHNNNGLLQVAWNGFLLNLSEANSFEEFFQFIWKKEGEKDGISTEHCFNGNFGHATHVRFRRES